MRDEILTLLEQRRAYKTSDETEYKQIQRTIIQKNQKSQRNMAWRKMHQN